MKCDAQIQSVAARLTMEKLTESQKQEYRKALQALRAERTKRILEIARESDRDSGIIPFWTWLFMSLIFPPLVFLGPFKGLRMIVKRKILKGTILFAVTSFFCVMLIIAIFSSLHPTTRSELRQLACESYQQAIRTQLEICKWEYGFYPAEAEWDAFLNEQRYWPPDHPAPKYCPAGMDCPYEYKSDSVPGSVAIANEHGTGCSEYELRCIYDDSHNLDIGN